MEFQLSPAPAAYLAQTYPNYMFDKAFSLPENGTLKENVVIIDANNTRYAVEFDASGAFVHAITIHSFIKSKCPVETLGHFLSI